MKLFKFSFATLHLKPSEAIFTTDERIAIRQRADTAQRRRNVQVSDTIPAQCSDHEKLLPGSRKKSGQVIKKFLPLFFFWFGLNLQTFSRVDAFYFNARCSACMNFKMHTFHSQQNFAVFNGKRIKTQINGIAGSAF